MRVIFKKVSYGADKDTILAVDVDSKFGDYYQVQGLFDDWWAFRDKEYLQRQCCNAKEKEYLSLLTKMKNAGKQIEVVTSLRF